MSRRSGGLSADWTANADVIVENDDLTISDCILDHLSHIVMARSDHTS
jgi:hypothetical protein